jgi:exonuclease SbcD
MRFLHTADWHLGRLFHQQHLTEDQAFVLRQVLDIARDRSVDAVVIAGDVYDRAVPPPEAVSLLDDTLSELVLRLKIPTILIAGNHDSPERLAFGSRLLAGQGLHVFGEPAASPSPVRLEDKYGAVDFYAAPYAEPVLVRERLECPDALDHERAMREVISRILASRAGDSRSVFVGHAFVAGATTSDSERPLSVGGAGAVGTSNFRKFAYAALGHLHRPQALGGGSVRYSGALLKYSFDEVGQQRSVTVVDMDAAGGCRIEEVALSPRRDLRVIEGTIRDLLRVVPPSDERDDFVLARLLDRQLILDPIGKLRQIYPNVLAVERFMTGTAGDRGTPVVPVGLSYEDLFASFFTEVTGAAPTPDEAVVFGSAVTELANREREVRA